MRHLVGRDRELAHLEQALLAAGRGRGALVCITGEPGIGKSQLALGLLDRAQEQGIRAVSARAWEFGSATPYGLVTDALRALDRSTSDTLAQEALALLEPGAHRTPELLFQSFEAAFVRQRSAFVFVLDDLHAADLDSLRFLLRIAPALQTSGSLVLVAQRSVDSGANADTLALLDALSRQSLGIELGGLDVAAVASFIQALCGRSADPLVAEAVQRATLGNPLFVDGVVRAAMADRSLDAGTIRVPPDVGRAISARVGRLGEEAGGMLRMAALLGRPGSAVLIGAAWGQAPEDVERLFELADTARLVTRTDDGQFTFRHRLVADALMANLAFHERAAGHARLAAALERVDGPQASPAEIAWHRARAVSVVGLDAAEKALLLAAEQASSLCAHEEAVRHWRDLLALIESHAPADTPRRLAALLGLGRASIVTGKRELGRARLIEAADLARRIGDSAALAHSALGVAETGEFGLIDRQKLELLEEAARCVPPERVELRFHVLSRLARELWADPRSGARRRELTLELLALARAAGDAKLSSSALDARFQALWGPTGRLERQHILAELRSLVSSESDPEARLALHRHGMLAAVEAGDLAQFSDELEAFAATAEPLHRPALEETTVQRRLLLALVRGETDRAERLIRECQQLGIAVQNPQAEMGYRFASSLLFADLGRVAALAELVAGFEVDAERLGNLPFVRARLANICALVGRPEQAQRHVDFVVRHALPRLNEDVSTLACLAFLAEAAWLLGDATSAAAIQVLLVPHREVVIAIGASLCLGAAERYVGLLEWTLGHLDPAIEALERAHALHRRMASPPWEARTARELGRLLRQRARSGDRERVRQLVEESNRIRRLGIDPIDIEEPVSLEAARPRRAPSASLTREGQIWSLEFAGEVTRLRDSKGLRLLATLLASPGQERHVLELVGAAEIRMSTADAGPVLDDQSLAAYRDRARALRAIRDAAEADRDAPSQQRARAELEQLEQQVQQALGLGGRRRGSGVAERARVAVAKALERCLKTLATDHRAAFEHLARTLRTGTFCSYDPDPSLPIVWIVTT